MCIAYLSLGHPDWPVLIAANRDEFHARPASPAGPWPGRPDVVAGRDLDAGGTWLGCGPDGRYALLTNYREPGFSAPAGAPSRGTLVRDYLLGETGAAEYGETIARQSRRWAGFNLILGTPGESWYVGNRNPSPAPRRLEPGTHVLSNHLLNTPWPKTQRLREALDALPPESWMPEPDRVFALLRDTTPAPEAELPRTGLSPAREKLLSSPFIVSPEYGTRCSTVIAIGADRRVLLSEQSYGPDGQPTERHDWRLPR